MESQQEASSLRLKKGFLLIALVAIGFALCAMMKTLVCGITGEICPCQKQPK